jgi:uncharacterized caspase-like protein
VGISRTIVCALVLALFVSSVCDSVAADAERRVALVLGNAAYQHAPTLPNPGNDQEDVARVLKRVGFDVVEGRDLDKRGMEQALARFSRLALTADVGLVFYAGHGFQYQGQNYLVPIDAKLEDEFSFTFEMMRVEDVLGALGRAKNVRILLLDACRNNPLADRLARSLSRTRDFGIWRGLAKIEQSQGMVIVYATQVNQVAADGVGRNSPFTTAFLKELEEPGLEIAALFRRVARSVNESTKGAQTPELVLSLLGEFYFNRAELDTEAWNRIRTSRDPNDYQDFIARHPKSYLADAARARLEGLERDAREKAEREEFLRAQAEREKALRERVTLLEQGALALRQKEAADGVAERPSSIIVGIDKQKPLSAEAEPTKGDVAAEDNPAAKEKQQLAAASDTNLGDSPASVSNDAAAPSDRLAALGQSQDVGHPAEVPKAVSPSRSDKESDTLSRTLLVKEIQDELVRVGCFRGSVDEKWDGPQFQLAVREFSARRKIRSPTSPTSGFLEVLRKQLVRVCVARATAAQCAEINERAQLGELSTEDRAKLQGECR